MNNPCENCNIRGKCCSYVELPLARKLSNDEARWVQLHEGLRIVKDSMSQGDAVRIEVQCSMLDTEGKCRLYNTSYKPHLCSIWPTSREQVPEGCEYLERIIQLA